MKPDGRPRISEHFILGVVFLLAVTAVLKLITASGESPALSGHDALFSFLTNRQLLIVAALVELGAAWFLVKERNVGWKLAAVAWLSLLFLAYRTVLRANGLGQPCACLGDVLTLWIGISPAVQSKLAFFLALGMFLGASAGIVARLLWAKSDAVDREGDRFLYQKPPGRTAGIAKLMVLVLLLSAAWFPLNAATLQYQVEGDLSFERYPRIGQIESTYAFRVAVDGCRWFIRMEATGGLATAIVAYFEAGYDGKEVRTYRANPAEVTRGGREPGGANIYSSETSYPHWNGNKGLSAVWLAYASQCYFAKSANREKINPRIYDLLYDDHVERNLLLRIAHLECDPRTGLPLMIEVLSNGVAISDVALIREPPPFADGFTNATFHSSGTIGLGDIYFAEAFRLETLGIRNEAGENQITCTSRWNGKATKIAPLPVGVSFVPTIPPSVPSGIADHRFEDELGGRAVQYKTNCWLEKTQVRSVPDFRRALGLRQFDKSRPLWASIMLALFLAGTLLVLSRLIRKTTKQ